jgi:hypothetical protein
MKTANFTANRFWMLATAAAIMAAMGGYATGRSKPSMSEALQDYKTRMNHGISVKDAVLVFDGRAREATLVGVRVEDGQEKKYVMEGDVVGNKPNRIQLNGKVNGERVSLYFEIEPHKPIE